MWQLCRSELDPQALHKAEKSCRRCRCFLLPLPLAAAAAVAPSERQGQGAALMLPAAVQNLISIGLWSTLRSIFIALLVIVGVFDLVGFCTASFVGTVLLSFIMILGIQLFTGHAAVLGLSTLQQHRQGCSCPRNITSHVLSSAAGFCGHPGHAAPTGVLPLLPAPQHQEQSSECAQARQRDQRCASSSGSTVCK
jgi:hypothetical protein